MAEELLKPGEMLMTVGYWMVVRTPQVEAFLMTVDYQMVGEVTTVEQMLMRVASPQVKLEQIRPILGQQHITTAGEMDVKVVLPTAAEGSLHMIVGRVHMEVVEICTTEKVEEARTTPTEVHTTAEQTAVMKHHLECDLVKTFRLCASNIPTKQSTFVQGPCNVLYNMSPAYINRCSG